MASSIDAFSFLTIESDNLTTPHGGASSNERFGKRSIAMIKEIASWDTPHAYWQFVVYCAQKIKTSPNATYMEIRLQQNVWDFRVLGFNYVLSLLYSNQVNRMQGV